MKILFVIDSLKSGGKERRLVSLIEGLKSFEDIEMELITLSKEIHYKSILDIDIKIHFLKRDIRKDFGLLSKFSKILNSFRPDIVHGWDNLAAIHFAPICKIKKTPFINSMITAAPKTHKLSQRYLANAISYPFSDVILSNSQAGLDNLFVPKQKQKVIYNGFNFNRVKNLKRKEAVFKKYKISKEKPIIGMVASFTNHKDYDTLIRAANILKDKFSIITIGDGENMEKMKELVGELNLKNIHFLGKQTDVESIVNIFDIGVLLSNNDVHGEGISNAIMEYMVLSKPIIATDGGGTKELVIDKETGFLIEPKNPQQLVEKITYLTKNSNEAMQIGESGKKRIEEFFTLDKMVLQTYQLYKKTVK